MYRYLGILVKMNLTGIFNFGFPFRSLSCTQSCRMTIMIARRRMRTADRRPLDRFVVLVLQLNSKLTIFIYNFTFSVDQVFEPLSAHRAMSSHGVDQVGFEERHILHSIRQHGTHGERARRWTW